MQVLAFAAFVAEIDMQAESFVVFYSLGGIHHIRPSSVGDAKTKV